MPSSTNRIIKVSRPIARVVVIPTGPALHDDHSAGNGMNSSKSASAKPPEQITLPADELEAEREAAFQKGLEEGTRRAQEELAAEFKERLERFDALVASIEEQQRNLIEESEKELLALLFRMVEKIVGLISQEKKDLIEETLRHLLSEAEISGRAKIRVNPADLETVNQMKSHLRQQLPDIKNLSINGDDSISRGGCVIETDLGKLDARMETRMSEMTGRLTKLYHELEPSTTAVAQSDEL